MAALEKHVDVKGLIPALDRRQVADPFVLDGKNFIFNAEGPYSAFGCSLDSVEKFAYPKEAQTFTIDTYEAVFCNNGVFKLDTTSNRLIPLYLFAEITTPGVWYKAVVGNSYYFARKGVGLLQYNNATNTWAAITTNVPSGARSVTQAGARLIVLGESTVAWSAIDDGTNLATSTTTGAGVQSLTVGGEGEGLAVLETFDGFIAYTKTGLLKFETINSLIPFRYSKMSTEAHPVSQFHIEYISDKEHVFLTPKGFYTTEGSVSYKRGQVPQPWQQLMSEYYVKEILSQISLEDNPQIRLWRIGTANLFFVSHAGAGSSGYYSYAHVLYLPVDKWGKFNREHTSIGAYNLHVDVDNHNKYGFLDHDGYRYKFNSIPQVEMPVTQGVNNYLFQPPSEIPAWKDGDNWIVNSPIRMSSIDESSFSSAGYFNVVYQYIDFDWLLLTGTENWKNSLDADEDWNDDTEVFSYSIVEKTYSSVDSYITVGLFRQQAEDYEDRLTLFDSCVIGMGEKILSFTYDDWNTSVEPDEDWFLLIDNEDWGESAFTTVDYDVTFYATIDGINVYASQSGELVVTDSYDNFREYELDYEGLYGHLKISAQEVDQSFHLKLLGVSGTLLGRL